MKNDKINHKIVEKFIIDNLKEELIKKGLEPKDYDLPKMAENIMEQVLYPSITEQIEVYSNDWKYEEEL